MRLVNGYGSLYIKIDDDEETLRQLCASSPSLPLFLVRNHSPSLLDLISISLVVLGWYHLHPFLLFPSNHHAFYSSNLTFSCFNLPVDS
ncbi:hypothetical protein QVD17_06339 [Tagetes erecta]|uniref:Uncharacterized protein n=1 Tax=Tagetes erecta TaxID=13708 RepID=A0AAD8LJZ6_TARER|nr:hypothetical protein QVD17_06339 [Tagetes erecta]